MGVQQTNIVWTDYSANLWKGCAKVSEGCFWCWSARMADRFDRTPEPWTVEHIDDNLQVYDIPILDDLAHLDPGWCFYPSSSDPYLPWLPGDALRDYFASIVQNDHLCFQVLTKYGPKRDDIQPRIWPENVMLGVSVETPRRTDRIDWLRDQTAPVKFVSFEPLIEPIDEVDLSGIDWVIVGGESHPNADERREMDPDWARDLYSEARRQDVPYLFKQHSGRYAEAETHLEIDGEPREIHEFPDTPGSLPNAPREFLA